MFANPTLALSKGRIKSLSRTAMAVISQIVCYCHSCRIIASSQTLCPFFVPCLFNQQLLLIDDYERQFAPLNDIKYFEKNWKWKNRMIFAVFNAFNFIIHIAELSFNESSFERIKTLRQCYFCAYKLAKRACVFVDSCNNCCDHTTILEQHSIDLDCQLSKAFPVS